MKRNKNRPETASDDIHRQAYDATQERQRVAKRRGNALQRAGAVLAATATLGTGAALATHQPKAEIAAIWVAGGLATGTVETAKRSQREREAEAIETATAVAANRILAAELQHEWPPLWATEHVRLANFKEALPEHNLSAARTVVHNGVILSADGTVSSIGTIHPVTESTPPQTPKLTSTVV